MGCETLSFQEWIHTYSLTHQFYLYVLTWSEMTDYVQKSIHRGTV